MLGPSHRAYIFRRHFAHTTIERPVMPISAPLLTWAPSRPRNLLNEIKKKGDPKESSWLQTPLKHSRKANSKRRLLLFLPPPMLPPWLNKAENRSDRLANEPQRGPPPPLQPSRRRSLSLDPRRDLRPATHHCPTCGQAIAVFSQQR